MPGTIALDNLLIELPGGVRGEVAQAAAQVFEHEAALLEALQQPENKQLFLMDPGALLRQLGIPVSEALQQHLHDHSLAAWLEHLGPYPLCDGQVIRPQVSITFTKGGE